MGMNSNTEHLGGSIEFMHGGHCGYGDNSGFIPVRLRKATEAEEFSRASTQEYLRRKTQNPFMAFLESLGFIKPEKSKTLNELGGVMEFYIPNKEEYDKLIKAHKAEHAERDKKHLAKECSCHLIK